MNGWQISERKKAHFWRTGICQGDLTPPTSLTVMLKVGVSDRSAWGSSLLQANSNQPGTVSWMLAEDTSLLAQRWRASLLLDSKQQFHMTLSPLLLSCPMGVTECLRGYCTYGGLVSQLTSSKLRNPQTSIWFANKSALYPRGRCYLYYTGQQTKLPLADWKEEDTLHLPRWFAVRLSWERQSQQKLSMLLKAIEAGEMMSQQWAIVLHICELNTWKVNQPAQDHKAHQAKESGQKSRWVWFQSSSLPYRWIAFFHIRA